MGLDFQFWTLWNERSKTKESFILRGNTIYDKKFRENGLNVSLRLFRGCFIVSSDRGYPKVIRTWRLLRGCSEIRRSLNGERENCFIFHLFCWHFILKILSFYVKVILFQKIGIFFYVEVLLFWYVRNNLFTFV